MRTDSKIFGYRSEMISANGVYALNKIILSADSTCDLDATLRMRYHVNEYPLHVLLGKGEYQDGVNITADEIYDAYRRYHILPTTAAVNVGEYVTYFKNWAEAGYSVIHFNLGSGLSSSYQNCCIAAKAYPSVYPVDSCNLSTGIGLLVLEAADRIAAGMEAEQIVREVCALRAHVHASFILDTLEFLHAGGRCSALAALGANFLNIKPCIEVDNTSGKMNVGKKYRGPLERVLPQYAADKLAGRGDLKNGRVFITHSGIAQEKIDLVKNTIRRCADFREIYVTRAGSTISSHCGPNTLGVLFMTK